MDITITIKIDDYEKTIKMEDMGKEKDDKVECSQYAKFFDEGCINWSRDVEYNLLFLTSQQAYANDLLKKQGYLFLNEVYDLIGISRTKEGQLVGWIHDENNPIGDNYVDFGIMDDRNKDFINGRKNTILLDFNVDGCIFDRLK